jgi:hypothetical protein
VAPEEKTMDLDAFQKQVHRLTALIPRIEAFLAAGGDHMSGSELTADVADIKQHLAEVADTVTGLQKGHDDTAAKLASLEGLEQMDRASLGDNMAWLAANRAALEVLLSLGDDPAAPAASGTANAGATAGTGAPDAGAGTSGPSAPDASQAASVAANPPTGAAAV